MVLAKACLDASGCAFLIDVNSGSRTITDAPENFQLVLAYYIGRIVMSASP